MSRPDHEGGRQRSFRYRKLLHPEGDDPLSAVANLFDVAMVFAVALILALFSAVIVPELIRPPDAMTIVKNPGTPKMEIITKKGVKIDRYRVTRKAITGNGQRLGVAYRLSNGEVVYVPEEEKSSRAPTSGRFAPHKPASAHFPNTGSAKRP
jgi:hypothetical protein